jgi:leucyl-tRNA synthetase
MQRYNPKDIEPKWQKKWDEDGIYTATQNADKPKKYVLEYFPYPSGAAMHVGHVRNYTIGDAVARHARMNGYNVLHPMGWDAFGLPAENYAIKNNISPQQAIAENTTKFKRQLMQMGFSYDWSREINSSDPSYYKWTQWFFELLLERGLAYQKDSLQWWCDFDKTVLANEQVEAGKCWRCGNPVVKKALKQWFFKITDYADRLVDDLDKLDWSEAIKSMQRNWIGKSQGAEISFEVDGQDGVKITVFTTRPDTLYGATFMVLAPENELVKQITPAAHLETVEHYIAKAAAKSDVERQETNREKTGVFTGAYAINPINGAKIPVWIADYVLTGYGTGAIMAVPAHDERDNAFAKKFDLPIIRVISNDAADDEFTHAEGVMMNSGDYDGTTSQDMRANIVDDLATKKVGKAVVNYKIRDWLISRQRYWGAPIPIIHCPEHGAVPVPKDQLPVELPEVESYAPNGEGTSVLAGVEDWVNTTCPTCGKPAKRETDTMDGFACSSWYFLRFADPHNNDAPFSDEKVKFWLPVDDYIGGAEHAVMHLLYARMWTKVMHDAGLIDFDEPFLALRNQGMILAPDGRKMSKSWGNTITPDEIIDQGYGADAIRVMELFIGPWDQQANWSVEGMGGCYRFLQRVWTLVHEYLEAEDVEANERAEKDLQFVTHKATKKVSEDLKSMGFNTAIAGLMELVNELYKIKATDKYAARQAWKESLETVVQLLAPLAPHISEELWQNLGHDTSVHISSWPTWNDDYLVENTMSIAIQVNGKLRGDVTVSSSASEEDIVAAAKSIEKVAAHLADQDIRKTIYVPKKLVNFVVG